MNKQNGRRKVRGLLLGGLFVVMMLSRMAAAQDLDDIKKSGVLLHLGVPYANFVSGSGDGMDVELMKLFAEHLGVRYQYVKSEWGAVIGDLTGKKIKVKGNDVEVIGEAPIKGDLIANGMTILSWRKTLMDFSTPTFPNQVWLVAHSDSTIKPIKPSGNIEKDIVVVKNLLRGRTLIGSEGTCLDPALYDLEITGAKLLSFNGTPNELAPALINREAELTLLDVPDALVALQKWPGKIKVIGPISEEQEMAVAFRKDSPKLRMAFNAFMVELKKNNTFKRIAKKYYPFAEDYYPEFFRGARIAADRGLPLAASPR